MLIMTSEPCPECGQLVYIKPHPKLNDNGEVITHGNYAIASNCYLDRLGVLCVTMMDFDTPQPSYVCIMCGWFVE